jgi:hypothetical protein
MKTATASTPKDSRHWQWDYVRVQFDTFFGHMPAEIGRAVRRLVEESREAGVEDEALVAVVVLLTGVRLPTGQQ